MTTKQLVTGALLSALTLVALYFTFLLPTNTLTFLTIASVMGPIALIRGNVKTSLLVYITSSILCLILMPLNIRVLYILFFGIYGLLKYFIEKLNHLSFEWILKLAFFNSVFFIGFKFIKILISPHAFDGLGILTEKFIPNVPYGDLLILILLGEIVFIVYDYALSLLIDTYYRYFSKY